jgi:hypothetical protein
MKFGRQCGVWRYDIIRRMNELKFITASSLPSFLLSWYGGPDQKLVEVDPDFLMPDPLREWYRLTSQWSVPVSSYNHFSAPKALCDHKGKLVFWTEHQGACAWGTDSVGEDPLVYENEGVIDEWESTGFPLSKFLLYVAVSEAVHGNRDALISLDMERHSYDSVVSGFVQLDDPLWRYPNPNWSYMTAEGMLAYGGIDPPSDAPSDHYWIMVSANRPESLERLPLDVFD